MRAVSGNGGRFAYVADRLFDGERVLADHAVVVEDGRVSAVVPRTSLPEGLEQWHDAGCTILPGLIDSHVHFMRWQGPLLLAHGVTTVRDVGNELAWVLGRRSEYEAQSWPRLLCTGPLLDGPRPVHPIVSRSCPDEAGGVVAVREMAAAGVDGIKLYVGLSREWLPAMVREGHAAGLKVSMHCSGQGVLAAGRAGVDEFFHLDGILTDLWPDHPPGWLDVWGLPEFAGTRARQPYLADAVRALGMAATPTLAYWDSQWRIRTATHLGSEEMRWVPREVVRAQGTAPADPVACERWRWALEAAQGFVGCLRDHGVPVLAGTDVPCGAVLPGLSLWRELSLLVGAGLSPLEALRAATSDAAAFLGQGHLGHLRPGASADLVLVRGNPLEAIPERPEVEVVVRGGRAYRPAELRAAALAAAGTAVEDPWGLRFALQGR